MKKIILFVTLTMGLVISACGTPSNGTDFKKKGEVCSVTAQCEGDLKCLTDAAGKDTGVCKEVTLCKENGRCDGKSQYCVEKDGLNGAKFNVCETRTPQPGKVQEGGECAAVDACDTGLECLAKRGSKTEGFCRSVNLCDHRGNCRDSKETCVREAGIGSQVFNVCRPNEFKKEGQECTANDTCETGTVCRAKEGSTVYGICERVKECVPSGNQCDTNTEECKPITVIGVTDSKHACLAKGFCTDTSQCNSGGAVDFICLASAQDQSRGKCEKVCSTSTCESGKDCVSVAPYRVLDGNSFGSYNVCKDKNVLSKAPLGSGCLRDEECEDYHEGAVCVQRFCTMSCKTLGHETECLNPQGSSYNWCLPRAHRNSVDLYCGPYWFKSHTLSIKDSAGKDESCGLVNSELVHCDSSQKSLHCILSEKGSQQGTCDEVDFGVKGCDPEANPSHCSSPETCQPVLIYGEGHRYICK